MTWRAWIRITLRWTTNRRLHWIRCSTGASADTAEDALDASRLRAFLRRCLGELVAVERQALVLAYEHGLSHGDLAAHLGKPLGTVKTWIRRGMLNLRACIDQCTGSTR